MAESFGCIVGGCVVRVACVYVCLMQFVHDVEGGVEFVVYLCCVFVWFALGGVGWFRIWSYAEVCPAGGGRAVGDKRLVLWCGGGGVVEVGLYGDSGDYFIDKRQKNGQSWQGVVYDLNQNGLLDRSDELIAKIPADLGLRDSVLEKSIRNADFV